MDGMVCRAATFPFFPHQPMEWKDLDPVLKHAWGMSTHLANWVMSELYMIDQLTVERDGAKISPMPSFHTDSSPKDLYGLFLLTNPQAKQWVGLKREASTIIRSVKDKYSAVRLNVVGRGFQSLPSFRFPFPFPIHNQTWKPFYGKDNVPLVSVALPRGRVILRLRGGSEMRRQLSYFRQLVDGAKRGEMSIHRRGKHVLAKLIGWFPLPAQQKANDRTLLVKTDPNALWVAEMEGTHPRVWNQDHMRHLVERHRIWRQRMSEDLKREKRVPQKMKAHMLHALEDRCRKMNDRLDTFCHEMTKQLAEFAVRQKVDTVLYDDQEKTWLQQFPWHNLREKLTWKLQERGIRFVCKSEVETSVA